jgi:hypothetical protein
MKSPLPPFAKGGKGNSSSFDKGGLRGIFTVNVINVWQVREYLSMACSFGGYDHAAGILRREEVPMFDLYGPQPQTMWEP